MGGNEKGVLGRGNSICKGVELWNHRHWFRNLE